MPIFTEHDSKEMKRYIKFLKESKNSSFMQSPSWANIKKNWKHFFACVENDGKIVIGMTMLIQYIPIIRKSIMYCPRGPVGKIDDNDLIKRLLNEIKPLIKNYNVFMLKVDPNVIYDEKIRMIFKEVGFKISKKCPKRESIIQPVYYMRINLKDKKENDIFLSFPTKTRYNIRYAHKKSIKVQYSNKKSDLKIFYSLFKTTVARDKFPGKSYEYFESILENFNSDDFRIYLAKYKNYYLAGALTFKFGNEVFYLYGATSNEYRNLKPMYALQWEMIKWGIENKCEIYNFGGLSSKSNNNGLYKFKSNFCTSLGLVEYIGEFTKVYNKFYYNLYKIIYPTIVKFNSKKNHFNIN